MMHLFDKLVKTYCIIILTLKFDPKKHTNIKINKKSLNDQN